MQTGAAVARRIAPATVLAVLGAFAVARTAGAGAPLKGVDVKLGKAPGGGIARVATTDAAGHFDLGVVPAGSYTVTLGPAAGAAAPAPGGAACTVDISGAVGGALRAEFDLGSGRPMAPAAGTTQRVAGGGGTTVRSDGVHPLRGTVVRSKSNISNN
jgi:hypothetical protein